MDSISLVGLTLAVSAILVGQVLEGGHVGSLLQPTAFLIVIGGTLGAVMLQHMATITLESLVEEQKAHGATVEVKPVRRAIAPQSPVRPPRTTAPNSVFAFGRSFAR